MALQKAYFKNLETGDNYQVQFNPTELSLSKSAQFAEITIPGLDAPVQQFVHGGAETLRVELFFDETDKGMAENATSITERTDAFYSLVKQNRETHAPPRCLFVWGPPTLTGILEATSDLVDALNELSEAAELDTERLNLANSWDSWAPYWFVCIVGGECGTSVFAVQPRRDSHQGTTHPQSEGIPDGRSDGSAAAIRRPH